MDAVFRPHFPKLAGVLQKKTSEYDERYNCIGWAFGDNTRHWWPNQRGSYWPQDASGKTKMQAFEEWFAADGWIETTDRSAEAGKQKVALFALNGDPTHAARLLADGQWTSKLGAHIDLSHGFDELDGPKYGSVVKIYVKAS